uniref:Coiled-coil domain-containing protein 130 (Trinotate prediction) n=1 Tax=Myxobolus squamalis TaxID=59785 RepID=A0A6B2G360_MYXSQ
MFRLEHTSSDKAKAATLEPTIRNLEMLKSVWKDDYSINSSLRKEFRTKKNELQLQKKNDTEFKDKHCLSKDLCLLPENIEDDKIAKSIYYGQIQDKSSLTKMVKRARKSSIFSASKTPISGKLKSTTSVNLLKKVLHKK